MGEISDYLGALVSFVAADSAVDALADGRVYGGELPEDEQANQPRAAVVIRPAPGVNVIGTGYQEYGDHTVDVFCYGETPSESHALWRAVHGALKNLRREVVGDTLLHWAQLNSSDRTLRDPDTTWPYTLSSYWIFSADRVIG